MTMKRTIRYILMTVAAVYAAAGCQLEEKVMVNPSDVIEPVLHDPGFPEVLTITPSNQSEEVCFTWDAADMGFGSQLNYSIEVSAFMAGEDDAVLETEKTALGGGVSATSTTVKYEDINYALVQSLGVEPETEVKVNFYLKASLGVRPFYSAPVSVRVVPTNAPKMFPCLYLIGSYSTWNFTKSQMMYDYAENGLKYQAVVDFGEDWMTTTKGGFKLTPKADWSAEYAEPEAWDKDYADRLASGALEKNPQEVQFSDAGGDCKRYSSENRFYHFTLSLETNKFTMEKAFDAIELVWNGESVPMEFNKANYAQKFYADVTVGMDDRFYVALDDEANTTFGADANGGQGLLYETESGAEVRQVEVIAAPGKYRLYVDLNNWDALTYEFNADMFDQEEGSASFGYKGWAICGFMNNWDGDLPMEQQEGEKACWWVAKDVTLKKDYDFCFRKDGAGAIVLKGGGFKVNQPVWHYGGGEDIHITQTGIYDIWLNPNNGCCWVLTPGQEPSSGDSPVRPDGAADWSISGPLTAGREDIYMYETQYGYMAKDVPLENGDEFYFRYLYRDDHAVKTTSYAGMRANTVGKTIDGTGSVKMILDESGLYDIYLTTACDTVYVVSAGGKVEDAVSNFATERPEGAVWGLCGSFTSWEEDLWLEVADGFYVARNLALRASDALKFRKDGNWGENGANGYGVEAIAKAGYHYPLYRNGGNIIIEKTGLYDVYMTQDQSRCYVLSAGSDIASAQEGKAGVAAWGIVGDHNNWGGDGDTPMAEEGGYYVTKGLKLGKGAKFKFRKDKDWKEQRSAGKTLAADMKYGVSNTNDCVVGSDGVYDIYLSTDLKTMYFMTAGVSPSEAEDGDLLPEVPDEKVDIVIYGKTDKENLYAWWEDDGEFAGTFPGTKYASVETIDGVEYKKWTLSVSKAALTGQSARFLFNTGGDANKTSDSDPVTVTDGLILVEKDGKPVAKAEIQGPENLSEWVIVGDFVGDWGLSVNMFKEGDYYVAYKVGIPAGSVFKFRKGSSWDVQKTFNGDVAANTKYSLGDAGYDDKSRVAVAGVYDIYVAVDMSAMYFMEEGKVPGEASVDGSGPNTNPDVPEGGDEPDTPETPDTPDTPDTPQVPGSTPTDWTVIGSFTGWSEDNDIVMYEEGDYIVAKNVSIPAGAAFKMKKGEGWGIARTTEEGVGAVSVNTPYKVVHREGYNTDITVSAAGTYDIYLSADTNTFYLMEQGKKPGEN